MLSLCSGKYWFIREVYLRFCAEVTFALVSLADCQSWTQEDRNLSTLPGNSFRAKEKNYTFPFSSTFDLFLPLSYTHKKTCTLTEKWHSQTLLNILRFLWIFDLLLGEVFQETSVRKCLLLDDCCQMSVDRCLLGYVCQEMSVRIYLLEDVCYNISLRRCLLGNVCMSVRRCLLEDICQKMSVIRYPLRDVCCQILLLDV